MENPAKRIRGPGARAAAAAIGAALVLSAAAAGATTIQDSLRLGGLTEATAYGVETISGTKSEIGSTVRSRGYTVRSATETVDSFLGAKDGERIVHLAVPRSPTHGGWTLSETGGGKLCMKAPPADSGYTTAVDYVAFLVTSNDKPAWATATNGWVECP